VPLWCTMVYVLDRPLSSNENVALYRVVCGHPRPRSDAVQQLPSQRVGGSRGPPNSFGAPTQVCGSPLERYPLVGRNGRRFCAFIRLGQRAFCTPISF